MIYANNPEEYAEIINKINLSIDKRLEFKERFMSNYQKQLISNYINSH